VGHAALGSGGQRRPQPSRAGRWRSGGAGAWPVMEWTTRAAQGQASGISGTERRV
jgi:hypothetical protein